MADLPTGTWLARTVVGSADASLNLGDVSHRLTHAIEKQFPQEPRHHRQQGFSLLISGFTWKRRRSTVPRPFQQKLTIAAKYPWPLSTEATERWIPPSVAAWQSIGTKHADLQAVTISRDQDIEIFLGGRCTPWILGSGLLHG